MPTMPEHTTVRGQDIYHTIDGQRLASHMRTPAHDIMRAYYTLQDTERAARLGMLPYTVGRTAYALLRAIQTARTTGVVDHWFATARVRQICEVVARLNNTVMARTTDMEEVAREINKLIVTGKERVR